MGVIDPEVGAIANYLWVEAQDNFVGLLKAISTIQAGINPDYEFNVESNVYSPTIANMENQSFVNVLVKTSNPDNSSRQNKNHEVVFYFDCYQLGSQEQGIYPADEVAVQRLQYLCAMVEYGLTALSNYYAGMSGGQIQPGKLDLSFMDVEDAEESYEPYAPARFKLVCIFPYTAEDLTLPDLERISIDLGNYALDVNY